MWGRKKIKELRKQIKDLKIELESSIADRNYYGNMSRDMQIEVKMYIQRFIEMERIALDAFRDYERISNRLRQTRKEDSDENV